jgi:hypothetical protein
LTRSGTSTASTTSVSSASGVDLLAHLLAKTLGPRQTI